MGWHGGLSLLPQALKAPWIPLFVLIPISGGHLLSTYFSHCSEEVKLKSFQAVGVLVWNERNIFLWAPGWREDAAYGILKQKYFFQYLLMISKSGGWLGQKTKSNGTHYIASRHCIAPFLTKKAFFLYLSMPGFSLLHTTKFIVSFISSRVGHAIFKYVESLIQNDLNNEENFLLS